MGTVAESMGVAASETLIIWDSDDLTFFRIPKDQAALYYDDILLAHGQYINSDCDSDEHERAVVRIDMLLTTAEIPPEESKDGSLTTLETAKLVGMPVDEMKKLWGSWHKYEIDDSKPLMLESGDGDIIVIKCGCLP